MRTHALSALLGLGSLALGVLATPEPTPYAHALHHHELAARAAAKKKTTSTSKKTTSTGKAKPKAKPARAGVWDGTTTIVESGKLQVAAMQLVVVSDNAVVVLDKAENNPGRVNGHAAWGQHYNVKTQKSTMLPLKTNSFCAGGTILSNGTLIALGGNPTYDALAKQNITYNDQDGEQSVRIFPKCSDSGCTVFEDPTKLRISAGRWYPSLTRLSDGSVFVTSGTLDGTFVGGENSSLINLSHEFYPAKNINSGMPIYSKFLADALPSYLFPVVYYLPDDTIFMAANKLAMRYDWRTNTEYRLPSLTARINYPWTAASALLPYTPDNNYTPEILFCGGSNTDDTMKPKLMTAQMPTVGFCQRMRLNDYGISQGWLNEGMPSARFMGEAIMLGDGKLMLVNGAQTGVAGFGNIGQQVGYSNADNPVFQPWLYDPTATRGSRFSTNGMPVSKHARMYHSTATLLPDGRIMVAGSNPNKDNFAFSAKNPYGTDYAIEYISPPYMSMTRPTIGTAPAKVGYGTSFTLKVSLPAGTDASQVGVNILELGYKTHGLAFDQRLVTLVVNSVSKDGKTLTVTGPPNNRVFPPGVGWLCVLANGVPSVMKRVIVGSGAAPPFDKAAYANMIKKTGAKGYRPPGQTAMSDSKRTKTVASKSKSASKSTTKKSSRRALDSDVFDL